MPLHRLAVAKNLQRSARRENSSHLVLALFGNKDKGSEEGGGVQSTSNQARKERGEHTDTPENTALPAVAPQWALPPRHSSSSSCPLGPPTTIRVSLVSATILVLG